MMSDTLALPEEMPGLPGYTVFHGSGVVLAPEPRQAFADAQHCQLMRYHAPSPVMVEYHHQKPVYLQNRLYGKIVYGPSLWVCGNCHDAVHAWLYWLLGERRQPYGVGRNAKAEAVRTFEWFRAEQARLGK